ncbi:MAG: two-component regulator propeller domain-containing protein [Bacteroidota bacterium]|nr:ATP-binding protein [Candidatus Kapabacteria bacterium]MDW8219382.1 two-component regulator propeller domain-containing protein [Bacteroidota bacterium]
MIYPLHCTHTVLRILGILVFLVIADNIVDTELIADDGKRYSSRALVEYVYGNSPLRHIVIDAWTTDNGLPHNAILDLKQTRDGYLWFASFNGVVRFDGITRRWFHRSVTPQLSTNVITTLWEDKRGHLWFGAQEGGIAVLRNDGVIHRVDSAYGFRDKMIRGWTENRVASSPDYGTVYCVANNGVYALKENPYTKDFSVYRDTLYSVATPEISQDILIDRKGSFWQATRRGLFYWASRSQAAVARTFDTSHGLPHISVECVYEDRSGTIWIGTRKGVCRFADGRIVRDTALLAAAPIPIHDFVEDSSGNLWIGTEEGLLLWTKSTSTPQCFRLTSSNGLTDDSIRSLEVDTEGNIWVGTYYGGLNRLRRSFFGAIAVSHGLMYPVVYALLQDSKEAMWIATYRGVQHVTRQGATTYTMNNGLVSSLARTLVQDSVGNVWIGTYGALHKVAPSGRLTTYTTRDGLVDDQIRSLCVARDSTLWIGTVRGISLFKNGRYTSMTTQRGDLPSNSILGIMQDRAGRMWISTNGGGVLMIDPSHHIKTHFYAGSGLPSNDAFQASESPRGDEIWIPCNGGITMVKNGKPSVFTTKDGLPEENIFHILEDTLGTVWMTCQRGIISVPKSALLECAQSGTKLSCRLYTRSDGLQTNTCTVPSFAHVTRTGELWIPMLKGIVIIRPEQYFRNTVPPPVYCQSVHCDTSQGIWINTQRAVYCPAGTQRLEIRYTAICFAAPERVQFKYKLEGIDDDWIDAGGQRNAFYTNLPPGTYVFRVKACNNDGVWNEEGDTLTLEIGAFFYQTWWFGGLCGIGAVGLGVLLVQWRTQRLRVRAAMLEGIVRQRTRQLEEHAEEIERQNREIKRQLEILDQQAREIELANSELNEKNFVLLQANEEIQRQQNILAEQAREIELANTELQERNAQLHALNQEKNEFLGIAAHDLKNPLAAIRMTVSMLQRYYDQLSKRDVLDKLDSIVELVNRMMNIITNLLDINAIESGMLNIQPVQLNLVDIVRKITNDYIERAAAKNIVLTFVAQKEHIELCSDATLLAEVCDNLISNAIKYSPFGTRVIVRVDSLSDKSRIAVQDEGPGLSDEDKAKLFGKFARLSARPTGGEHSTGLGLNIVKRIVEALNGHVWCESELGRGATFYVELPVNTSTANKQDQSETTTNVPI